MCNLLLDYGASVNQQAVARTYFREEYSERMKIKQASGATPFFLAIQKNELEIAELFAERGAQVCKIY